MNRTRRSFLQQGTTLAGLGLVSGCWSSAGPNQEVVVYSALDREFSEPILNDFTSSSKIVVRPKYDVESTKTVGLATALDAESKRPRCDLFWNNEILQTLRLMRKGILEPYKPKAAADFPADSYDPEHRWHGLAARGRVLLVNMSRLGSRSVPKYLTELAAEGWRGDVALAKPLFGTTATHAAMLFATWGEERAKKFFMDLKQNGVQVVSGNKHVATAVGRGEMTLGVTDTDDGLAEILANNPVEMFAIGQSEDHPGALRIPNTLSLMKGSPNPEAGKQLVEYLLSPAVEDKLAASASGQIPVRTGGKMPKGLFRENAVVQWMPADFEKATDAWDASTKFLREEFLAD